MNQIALIFSDNYYITVADNREMLPNRCHSATVNEKTHVFTPFQKGCLLFPLDRSRRLCGNIIHNAVDILNLVDDTGRDHFQHLIRNPCEVCGHEVRGSYPTESQCVVIGSSVAHYTNGTHIGQHCEVLVNAPVQSGLGDLLAEDPVSVLQNGQLFVGDFADDTNCQTRTRKRLPPYQIFRQTVRYPADAPRP